MKRISISCSQLKILVYLGSNISSIESDVNIPIGKAVLLIIWKSDLPVKNKTRILRNSRRVSTKTVVVRPLTSNHTKPSELNEQDMLDTVGEVRK